MALRKMLIRQLLLCLIVAIDNSNCRFFKMNLHHYAIIRSSKRMNPTQNAAMYLPREVNRSAQVPLANLLLAGLITDSNFAVTFSFSLGNPVPANPSPSNFLLTNFFYSEPSYGGSTSSTGGVASDKPCSGSRCPSGCMSILSRSSLSGGYKRRSSVGTDVCRFAYAEPGCTCTISGAFAINIASWSHSDREPIASAASTSSVEYTSYCNLSTKSALSRQTSSHGSAKHFTLIHVHTPQLQAPLNTTSATKSELPPQQ